MTARELEAINKIVDQIGAALDTLCDMLNSIEEGKTRSVKPKKKRGK
jgi:hypothetical protein